MEYSNMRISELQKLSKNDLKEFLRPKRVSVAEHLTKQNLDRKPEDLLTGDKEPILTLPPTTNTITLRATDEKSDIKVPMKRKFLLHYVKELFKL